MLPALKNLAGVEQYGSGLNGGACDLAHLNISQAMAYAMQRNFSAGVAFLDIKAAFASMMRCIAIPADDAADAAWAGALMSVGFSRTEAVATIALAVDALRWAGSGTEAHFIALLAEAHENT